LCYKINGTPKKIRKGPVPYLGLELTMHLSKPNPSRETVPFTAHCVLPYPDGEEGREDRHEGAGHPAQQHQRREEQHGLLNNKELDG
jgi:hypothetical protein